jgi:hypothetical protein
MVFVLRSFTPLSPVKILGRVFFRSPFLFILPPKWAGTLA